MDSLKLIPSAFFDAIARVVPGAAAIVAYLFFAGETWSQILARYLGSAFAEKEALLTSTVLFFLSAYVVGQLLSPFAKEVQRIGESMLFDPNDKAPKAPKDAYDWLRVNNKEAGAQCAKIRAEFTMHNGLAVVFFGSFVWYLLRSTNWNWLILDGLLLAAISTAIRGRTTRDTFNETVKKLANASGFSGRPAV